MTGTVRQGPVNDTQLGVQLNSEQLLNSLSLARSEFDLLLKPSALAAALVEEHVAVVGFPAHDFAGTANLEPLAGCLVCL